jgi:DNA-binding winged helix-turn-helix (wHTH) protein
MRYAFEDYVLDLERRELRRGAALVKLEPQAFDFLALLLQHRDRVVSRDELLQTIWQGRAVSDAALTTRINTVRRAIGDHGKEKRLIRALPRKGLRFVGEVTSEQHRSEAVSPGGGKPIPTRSGERPSIAVLPFTNMSGDPEQEYFVDGTVEEIITALSRIRWFSPAIRASPTKGKPSM